MKPKKKFYTFKEGDKLPMWLGYWESTAESTAKKRELNFKNRNARITFNCGCTVSIKGDIAFIRPIKGVPNNKPIIKVDGLDSFIIFGVGGALTPYIVR